MKVQRIRTRTTGAFNRPSVSLSRMPGNWHVRFLEGLGAGNGPCLLDRRLFRKFIMPNSESSTKQGGMGRLIRAFGNQYVGFTRALKYDPAIRQVLGAVLVMVVLSMFLPISTLEHLILVLSMMLVVLLEFVNSAIEATVDRISTEHHPLSGQAKDLSSVAVAIAVLMSGLCWVVIAGPLAIQWLSKW